MMFFGLLEHAPVASLADKGYDAGAIAERNIEAVIPRRSNRPIKIERMFGLLKINRAIATRYDQLANSFLGVAHLATARYWLKFVHVASRWYSKSGR
ncbi:transposase [Sphingobium yanoikuyae]|uniref:transposase n=1 Tax=Sphingobium yanoikuyae TaxID=13690 RepID=UPI0035B4DC43